MNRLFLIFLIIIVGVVIAYSVISQKSKNSPMPISRNTESPKLFLGFEKDRTKSNFYLYDVNNKNFLEQRIVDFGSLGWDINSERAFYDPKTDSLIYLVRANPGGIAGTKPAGTLPDPPFSFAIYRSRFQENAPLEQLYIAKNIYIRNVEYQTDKDLLVFTSNEGPILVYDFNTKQIKTLGQTIKYDPKDSIEYLGLKFSQDGQRVFQLVKKSLPHPSGGWSWIGEKIDLNTIDLSTGNISTVEMVTDDGINTTISGLSQDAKKILYVGIDKISNRYKMWLKDTAKNTKTEISYSGDLDRVGASFAMNDNWIIYKIKNGWSYYDLNSKIEHQNPRDLFFVGDVFEDKVLTIENNKNFIIYNLKTFNTYSELNFEGISTTNPLAIQWVSN